MTDDVLPGGQSGPKTDEDYRISEEALEWLSMKGVAVTSVRAVLNKPSRRIRRDNQTETAYHGDGLVVFVTDDKLITTVGWSMTGSPLAKKASRRTRRAGGGASLPKTWEDLDKAAAAVGLRREELASGHIAYFDGDKQVSVRPSTGSDWRGVANQATFLIRAGYNVRRGS
jgi:hypothetical protein